MLSPNQRVLAALAAIAIAFSASVATAAPAYAATSTTTVESSQNPVVVAEQLALVARVSIAGGGVVQGGTVAFTASGTAIAGCDAISPDSDGTAVCFTSFVTAGSKPIVASYSGVGADQPSTSGALTQTVTPASTQTWLEAAAENAVAGIPMTYTAHVQPVPIGGTITFLREGTAIAGCTAVAISTTGTAAGTATCTTSNPAVSDPQYLSAVFPGTADYLASRGELAQQVIPPFTTTTVSSGSNPSGLGRTVTYTATVSLSPSSGVVTFTEGGSAIAGCIERPVSNGVATCAQAYAATGTHTLSASYSGSSSYYSSESNGYDQHVAAVTTVTSNRNPSSSGQSVTYTATVSPAPIGGTVMFVEDDIQAITGCANQVLDPGSGTATCTRLYPTPGQHSIVARYSDAALVRWSISPAFAQTIAGTAATYATPGTSTFTVPDGWTDIRIEAWGAAGNRSSLASTQSPGRGGGVLSQFAVTPGEALQVSVGAQGGGAPRGLGYGQSAGAGGGASKVVSGTRTLVVAGGGGGVAAPDAGFYLQSPPCGGDGGANADGSGNAGCTGTSALKAIGGDGGTATSGGAGGAPGPKLYYDSDGRAQITSHSAGANGSFGSGGQGGYGEDGGGSGGDGYFGGGGGGGGGFAYFQNTYYGGWAGGGGGGSSYADPAATTSRFLGAARTADGSVVITHAATQVVLDAPAEEVSRGATTVLTATLRDSGGNVVSTGTDAVLPVTFEQTGGTGAITGLTTVTAVNGVATLTVTGSVMGTVSVVARHGAWTSATRSLTVAKQRQTIDIVFPATALVYGSSATVTATATSGLPVTLYGMAGCETVPTADGWRVTATSGWMYCRLIASQAGNDEYAAAPYTEEGLWTTRRAQSITLTVGRTTSPMFSTFAVTAHADSALAVTVTATGGCSATPSASAWEVTMTSPSIACVLTADQPGDLDNLPAPSVQRSIAATQATQSALTVAAPDDAFYGDHFEVTAAGGSGTGAIAFTAAGSGCSVVSTTATTATLSADAAAQPCGVTVTRLADDDYAAISATVTPVVLPRVLTVDAVDATAVYGEPDPQFGATLGNVAPGDSVTTIGATGEATCIRESGSAVGHYDLSCAPGTIAAPNYAFATGSTATFAITQRDVTITAPDLTASYGGTVPEILPSYAGLAAGETQPATPAVCVATATASSPVGDYATLCSDAADGNYAITYVSGRYTITPVALVVTAPTLSKLYGAALGALVPRYDGLVNGDSATAEPATCSTTATPATPTGDVVVSCADAVDDNYVVSYVAGTITVTPTPLTITAIGETRMQGTPNAPYTIGTSGFVNGDTSGSLGGAAAFATSAVRDSAPGTYPLTVSGLASANYTISYRAGTVTVTALPAVPSAVPFAAPESGEQGDGSGTGETGDDVGSSADDTAGDTAGDAVADGAAGGSASGTDGTAGTIGVTLAIAGGVLLVVLAGAGGVLLLHRRRIG